MSTDFETMPKGTRAALIDATKLLRASETEHRAHHAEWKSRDDEFAADAAALKADRHASMAERIERLLEQ